MNVNIPRTIVTNKYMAEIITNIIGIVKQSNKKYNPTIPAVKSIPNNIENKLGMLCFTTIASLSQSKLGSHKLNNNPENAIMIT